MSTKYSPSANAFFDSDMAAPVPEDAVDISAEQHAALLRQLSSGRALAADSAGRPVATDRPPLTREQLHQSLRKRRDRALQTTDGLVTRHRDQLDAGTPTTLTADQYVALLRYRQDLRDITNNPAWPNLQLPKSPI